MANLYWRGISYCQHYVNNPLDATERGLQHIPLRSECELDFCKLLISSSRQVLEEQTTRGSVMDPVLAEASRKAAWRILPFVILLYLVAYLDRVNIGYAALTMNSDLKISPTEFGFAASVFFIGYVLFEIPSNIALTRFGVPVWIGRIMITWGLASMGTAFVTSATALYVMRFILGTMEAGFFPGILIYTTLWFPAAERGNIFGLLQAAAALSAMLGAPISTFILTSMNGVASLSAWKWLFLVEGLPAVILGFICFRHMTTCPKEAKWLNEKERKVLQAQLDLERSQKEAVRKYTLLESLTNPRILMLAFLFFFVILTGNAIGFWLPQIIQSFGYSTMAVGWLTALPNLVGAVVMVMWGRHSDATGERTWHFLLPLLITAAGFLIAGITLDKPVLAVIALSVAAISRWCAIAIYWTWPTATLTGVAAAGGVALINSIAQISGIIGPWAIGWSREATGGFSASMIALGVGCLIAVAVGLFWSHGVKTLRHQKA
jgi:MFS transporter, ACS family, tartrate transporter